MSTHISRIPVEFYYPDRNISITKLYNKKILVKGLFLHELHALFGAALWPQVHNTSNGSTALITEFKNIAVIILIIFLVGPFTINLSKVSF